MGCQTMGCDIEPQRVHAPRVVSDTLQRQPKGCPNQILHSPISDQCTTNRKKVKGFWLFEINITNRGRSNLAKTLEPIEQSIVLLCQIKKCDTYGQGDHDGVYALCAN